MLQLKEHGSDDGVVVCVASGGGTFRCGELSRMSKRIPSLALLCALILSALGTVVAPGSVKAARSGGVPLFAAAAQRDISAGEQQKVFVHTLAQANVTLTVAYGNGQNVTLTGTTDDHGKYLFTWTAAYMGTKVALARYRVNVSRVDIHSSARGDFVLYPPMPLHINAIVDTPVLHNGDTLRARVYSRPGVALTFSVRNAQGAVLFTQVTTSDASGMWAVSTPLSTTATGEQHLRVAVTGDLYGRHAVTGRDLTLRPQLRPLVPVANGNPAPTANRLSLDAARRKARAAADGSLPQAQSNAQAAVQQITVDLQALAQWTSSNATHDASYYQGLLGHAGGYDAYIDAAAQALADDASVQARMRAVMPHKAIMVSVAEQALRAYEDGRPVQYTLVTTGRPELPTVTGHFAIYEKVTPFQFISPWPQGSPFYYAPTWIKYWMPFYSGYGMHDAYWRAHYGPGTNVTGDGPGSSEPTGTHGCVNIPFAVTQWLWNWAPVGTPVVVYGGPNVKAGTAGI